MQVPYGEVAIGIGPEPRAERPSRRRRSVRQGRTGVEMRAVRKLLRETDASPLVFVSECGAPFATAGFGRMSERLAAAAGLEIKAHAHMLRRACGYALANRGHDARALQACLGHNNIQHTVRYTEIEPDRFRNFGETETQDGTNWSNDASCG